MRLNVLELDHISHRIVVRAKRFSVRMTTEILQPDEVNSARLHRSMKIALKHWNSRRRLSWCTLVVASQTPLSAVASRRSRKYENHLLLNVYRDAA